MSEKDTVHPYDASTLNRSAEIWFDDGNAVLVAGDMTFRVHISVLSRKSAVFRDLFDIPKPSDEYAFIDECPVYYLPHSECHITALLQALYGQLCVIYYLLVVNMTIFTGLWGSAGGMIIL